MVREQFVGRGAELATVGDALDRAVGGRGSAMVVSGEPGIGKSKLVEQCLGMGAARGMMVLQGNASSDSAEPFLIFSRALRGFADKPLLAETENISFSAVFLASESGETVSSAVGEGLDAATLANIVTAIQSFVSDSFQSAQGHIGRMTIGDLTILAEECGNRMLCAVVRGAEHESMAREVKAAAAGIGSGEAAEPMMAELASMKFTVRRDLSGVKLANERNRLADRTLDLLERATGDTPILMVFEDMHWSDEVSMSVFGYLARVSPGFRLAIIATARPSESPAWDGTFEELTADGSLGVIPLTRMDEGTIRALVDSAYSPNRFPDKFYSRLAKDCEGNPLFTVEMVSQMFNDGSVALIDGAYTLAEENYAMPGKVEDIVMRRLQALDTSAMALVEYVSCAGREFQSDLAMYLPSVREPAVALAELEARGILTRKGDGLQFRHAMFREAIYRNITGKWRSSYHKAIGEYYELNRKAPDDFVYDLAWHFSHSNESNKAFGYCMRAAETAESTFAAERAIEFFNRALEALPRMMQADAVLRSAEIIERVGDLQTLICDFESAAATYRTALGKYSENGPKARMHRKLAEIGWKVGDYDSTLEEVTKGEALADDELEKAKLGHQTAYVLMRRGDFQSSIALCRELLKKLEGVEDSEKELAYVLDTMGSCFHGQGDYVAALDHYTRCLQIVERLGDMRKTAVLYNNIGNVYGDRLQNEVCMDYYSKASQIFEKIGDKQGVAVIESNTGAVHHSNGDPYKALACYEKSLRMAEAIGDLRMISNGLGNLGATHSSLGDFRKSIEMYTRAKVMFERMEDNAGVAWAHSSIGASHHQLGDTETALEHLRIGVSLCEEMNHQWKLCPALLYLGDALKDAGDADASMAAYARALDIANTIDSKDIAADSLCGMAEILASRNELDKALEYVSRAEEMTAEAGLNVELAHAQRSYGSILAQAGKRMEAEEKFARSRETYSRIKNKVGSAILGYEHGKALMAWGEADRGRPKVAAARESFAKFEMRLWMARCDSLLGGA